MTKKNRSQTSVLGRKDSASWSRRARRLWKEACKAGEENSDRLIGPKILRTRRMIDFKKDLRKQNKKRKDMLESFELLEEPFNSDKDMICIVVNGNSLSTRIDKTATLKNVFQEVLSLLAEVYIKDFSAKHKPAKVNDLRYEASQKRAEKFQAYLDSLKK